MRCILASLSLVLQIVAINGAVNYCGSRMCGHTNAHTYCKYRPGPSSSCSGYMEAALSAEEKTRVLARLNQRRGQLAQGWRHWPPAGDMLKLDWQAFTKGFGQSQQYARRWIEELSREAQRWADQCRSPQAPEEHDLCRDLYSISVGQCVASIVGEAPGLRPESMVDMWFMQNKFYDGNVTSYVPAHDKNYYGDFAQMIWSKTYLVGCGRSRFMAEWRGRLRSVERLVCNFAPRGPVPTRPLWTPADPASICPSRSSPDTTSGLCVYQIDVKESESIKDSLPVEDHYLLETVLELEKNESLNYLGSLDELYLTKIAIATIGTPMPVMPLYYSLQKRDVFKHSLEEDGLLNLENKSEVADNSIPAVQVSSSTETLVLRTKAHTKTKINIIGRPKPYDINELNEATSEKGYKNINDIEDVKKNKDKDFYSEYGLVEIEENDIVNSTSYPEVLFQPIHNDTTTHTDAKSEKNEIRESNNTAEGMVGSENYFINASEEINDIVMNNKSVEDYLSDPETVRALQDALEQMERTLASPRPTFTSGKVRRELRNLEANLQKVTSTEVREVVTATTEVEHVEAMNEEERNKSKDRAPMLSMVLKYMPYLKPYENTIVGKTVSYSNIISYDLFVVSCSCLFHILA